MFIRHVKHFSAILYSCIVILCVVSLISCSPGNDKDTVTEASANSVLSEINDAIRNYPNDPENYVRRAEIHRDSANYGDAVLDMAQAMKLDSVNERYHHLLADIYLKSLKSQFALGTMERAAGLFPDSIRTLIKLAEMQLIVKQYDRMSSTLRQAMTLDPQNTEALFLLGYMYREQGDLERAIQSFQTLVEIDSENAEAWTMLGNLLDIKGDPAALQCFENAIQINPQYPQGWHSKAYYLQNHGKVQEAIAIYDQIHQIDPQYIDAWLNQGILYLEMDSVTQASAAFSKIIEIDNAAVVGHFYAGVAAQQGGDHTLALQHYERAQQLDPANERIKKAIEQVK